MMLFSAQTMFAIAVGAVFVGPGIVCLREPERLHGFWRSSRVELDDEYFLYYRILGGFLILWGLLLVFFLSLTMPGTGPR